MAAPLLLAGKVAVRAAAQKVQQKYPGGIIGLVVSILAVWLLYVYIVIGGIVSLISTFPTGDFLNEDQCLFVEDFSYVSSESGDYGGSEGSSSSSDDSGSVPEASQLLMPLTNVQITSNYGPRNPPKLASGGYGSSVHLGTDYGAPNGTALYAVADGLVHQAMYFPGHGNRVVMKHKVKGKNWYVLYAHMPNGTNFVKKGDIIKAGQRVGTVGATGNTQGRHLHMEVWGNPGVSGAGSVNPQTWLTSNGAVKVTGKNPGSNPGSGGNTQFTGLGGFPDDLRGIDEIEQLLIDCDVVGDDDGSSDGNGVGAGAWGGHTNGKIPASALCNINTVSAPYVHQARCDAAKDFDELSRAYKAKFGSYISITDSYRSYEAQVAVKKAKPFLAATPGTSNHGWALAVDLASGINSPTSTSHKWMKENAHKFGWIHPSWAHVNGSKPEAWHWEYAGQSDNQGLGTVGKAKSYAKSAMGKDYGWGADEYSCLVKMWQKESDWDYKAANPISTARGIPQAMMSIHFGAGWKISARGKEFLTTPSVQIDWGLKYIKGRYSTPCNAWAYWQNNNHY